MLPGRIACFTFFAVVFLPVIAKAEDEPDYLPHRAVYDLDIVPSQHPSSRVLVDSGSARLVYEFTGNRCTGYTTQMRFIIRLRLQKGKETVLDASSNATESGDGRDLRFSARGLVDGSVKEFSEGAAHRKDDGAIEVKLTKPLKKTLTLQSDTVFPTDHARHLLDTARQTQNLFNVNLYDGGAGGERVFFTSTVIGASIPAPPAGHPTDLPAFKEMPRWPMSMSFFNSQDENYSEKGEKLPLYQIFSEVYANGVTHTFSFDYGHFALQGHMTSIELLPVTPCNPAPTPPPVEKKDEAGEKKDEAGEKKDEAK